MVRLVSRMKKAHWARWLAFGYLPVALATSLGNEAHIYLETTGDKTSVISWTLEQASDVKITVQDEGEVYVNHCDVLGTTFGWRFRGKDTDVIAHRSENLLEIRGIFHGEEFQERHPIDSAPWYQTLAYALRPLVATDATSLVFWTIRPDNLDVVKMEAKREGPEKIAVNGEPMQTEKVRINPNGFLSRFWHAHYWFRLSDRVFVRYEGVHGPPGHPKTVIQLQQG